MPRYADHEERRDELGNTVVELILEHGIDRVSVRNVAQASGWSVGAVRYYFPRHDDLLSHALSQVVNKGIGRIRSAEATHADDPLQRAIEIVNAVAPVNEQNRQDLRIWMAFVDRGLAKTHIQELMADIWRSGRHFSRRMVASMAGIPLPEDFDHVLDDPFLEETAIVLHIMWDGVNFQGVMSEPNLPPENVHRLVRRILLTISDRVALHLESDRYTEQRIGTVGDTDGQAPLRH